MRVKRGEKECGVASHRQLANRKPRSIDAESKDISLGKACQMLEMARVM